MCRPYPSVVAYVSSPDSAVMHTHAPRSTQSSHQRPRWRRNLEYRRRPRKEAETAIIIQMVVTRRGPASSCGSAANSAAVRGRVGAGNCPGPEVPGKEGPEGGGVNDMSG